MRQRLTLSALAILVSALTVTTGNATAAVAASSSLKPSSGATLTPAPSPGTTLAPAPSPGTPFTSSEVVQTAHWGTGCC